MTNRSGTVLLLAPCLGCLLASAVVLSDRAEASCPRRGTLRVDVADQAPTMPAGREATPEVPATEVEVTAPTSNLDVTLDALRSRRITFEVTDRDLDEVLARIRIESGVEIRRVDPDRNPIRMTLRFCEASLGQVLDVVAGMNLLTCAVGENGVVYVGSSEAIGREPAIGADAVLLSSLGWNRVSMH